MTKEEAVHLLQGVMSPEIAAELRGGFEVMPQSEVDIEKVNDICRLSISALQEQIQREQNKPLTVAEILEMDGEPVWCEEIQGQDSEQAWGIVVVKDPLPGSTVKWFYITGHFWAGEAAYGKTWLAYRHKPEGGAK